MKKYTPLISAFGFSLFVGLSFLMTKIVVDITSPFLLLAHRYTIAFAFHSIFLIITKNKINITRQKLLIMLPITLLFPILNFAFQAFGLMTTSSSEGGIIYATVPIVTIIFLSVLGRFPSRVQVISIFVSVSGVLIIFARNFQSSNGNTLGIVLLFLSVASFSLYTINVKRVMKTIKIHEFTFIIMLVGFVFFNIMFLFENGFSGNILINYLQPFDSSDYLLGIIYLGIFASVLASIASNYSLTHLSPAQFSVFSNLSTLISIAAGAIILGEVLNIYHYLGSFLILIGVIGTNFSSSIEKFFQK